MVNYCIKTNYGIFYLLDIIENIKSVLKKNFENIVDVYLFGSYARGDFDDNSDIDFFLVYDDFCDEKKLSEIEMDLLFKYGIEINFITESKSDYDNKTNYFLIENLKKDGINIWI